MWFSTLSTSDSSYSSLKTQKKKKKKITPKEHQLPCFIIFFFFRIPPFSTIQSHIIMIQSNKNSKFKLTRFPSYSYPNYLVHPELHTQFTPLIANIASTTNNDAYVCTWNSNCQFGGIKINAFMYFYLIWSQAS